MLCKVGFDLQCTLLSDNQTLLESSLEECLEFIKAKKAKVDLLFEYDAAYLKPVQMPQNVVNRKNWEIYQIKEYFASNELIYTHIYSNLTLFISLNNVKNLTEKYCKYIKSIDWMGNNLCQLVNKSLWFASLAKCKIIILEYNDKYVIQGFYEQMLLVSRVISKQYILTLEIDETVRYIAKFIPSFDKWDVVMLGNSSENQNELQRDLNAYYYSLPVAVTESLYKKQLDWLIISSCIYNIFIISFMFFVWNNSALSSAKTQLEQASRTKNSFSSDKFKQLSLIQEEYKQCWNPNDGKSENHQIESNKQINKQINQNKIENQNNLSKTNQESMSQIIKLPENKSASLKSLTEFLSKFHALIHSFSKQEQKLEVVFKTRKATTYQHFLSIKQLLNDSLNKFFKDVKLLTSQGFDSKNNNQMYAFAMEENQ